MLALACRATGLEPKDRGLGLCMARVRVRVSSGGGEMGLFGDGGEVRVSGCGTEVWSCGGGARRGWVGVTCVGTYVPRCEWA